MTLHPRELAWDGCLNVRDLGGHRTADGGETRYRAVVRADSVRQFSEERLRPRHDVWIAEAETEAERERLRRVLQSPAAAMVGVLAALEERYGSVEDYLRAAGVTDEELELARARLRG